MIKKCYDEHANDKYGMLYGMNVEPKYGTLKEGKRLFHGISNISDKAGMYPVDNSVNEELLLRTSDHEYYDKSKIKYIPPPVTKDIHRNHSFVHNVIQNKNKINLDHFYKIYNRNVLNIKKHKIIAKMHEDKVDFRMLTAFKNAMFDSEELVENHLIPMHVWTELKAYEMIYMLDKVEPMILEECRQGDMVNLQKFCDIVDLFVYLPMQKLPSSNDSTDVFYLMSGNTYGGPTSHDMIAQGGPLKRMLDLIWIKIADRFKGMAEAYRYFDVNFNNRVSFNEF